MQTPDKTLFSARIALLRRVLREQKIDAILVPSSDPHLSEYLPGRWQGREWLTGFTGSVGALIVTPDFAGLWTDGRYWIQAESQLADTGVALMKMVSGAGDYIDWLADNVSAGGMVAVDGAVLGLATARQLGSALGASHVQVRFDADLLQQIWSGRPELPGDAIYPHLAPHASTSRSEKLRDLRAAMAQHGASHHVISTLDDIAWLFNLRGADVSFNPVFVAHALIGMERATLFVQEHKVTPALRANLSADGVDLAPYEQALTALAGLAQSARLLLDPQRITYGTLLAVAPGVALIEAINPSTFAKSIKSAADVAHVRAAMEQDGVALCEFFAWFEDVLAKPQRAPLTELDIDAHLTQARARRDNFVSPSFATIAGFNANGAIIHYRATEAAHATIEGDGLLLIDSGGQYLGGTTDITRVVPIGHVSSAQQRDFTLVLKGMIALSMARFPRGAKAPMLDAIARAPIWAAGIDYSHGTGHGVGYFLNVHEGPQSIAATAMPLPQTAMKAGMITSIEPGIYRGGKWGIRIENLVLNCPFEDAEDGQFGDFLRFETLTLCPIDTRCIAMALLRSDEAAWLNEYHATVRTRLQPLLSGAALHWLNTRTEAI